MDNNLFNYFSTLVIYRSGKIDNNLIQYEYSIFIEIYNKLCNKDKEIIYYYLKLFIENYDKKKNKLLLSHKIIKKICRDKNISLEHFDKINSLFESKGVFLC